MSSRSAPAASETKPENTVQEQRTIEHHHLNLQSSLRTLNSKEGPKEGPRGPKSARIKPISMFSTPSFSVTVVCVVALMMMMMMKTEAMPKHSAKMPKKSHGGAALKTVSLQLDPSAFTRPTYIRSLQNDSISPWTYNITHDDSLYPPVLSEARCSLHGCLDSEGQEDQSLQSRPIMHQVLLLRRVRPAGSGDNYHFRLESRLIAVGCTCIRPIVTPQN